MFTRHSVMDQPTDRPTLFSSRVTNDQKQIPQKIRDIFPFGNDIFRANGHASLCPLGEVWISRLQKPTLCIKMSLIVTEKKCYIKPTAVKRRKLEGHSSCRTNHTSDTTHRKAISRINLALACRECKQTWKWEDSYTKQKGSTRRFGLQLVTLH